MHYFLPYTSVPYEELACSAKISFSPDVFVRIAVVVSNLQKVLEEVHVFDMTRLSVRQDFDILS